MFIMTFFLWTITFIMWLICGIGRFDKTVRPMFWVGLYTFCAGLIPFFGD